jgi:hypothetical protein
MLAFTPIIGKISDGNLMSLTMKKSNAPNGKPKTSYRLMQMVASMNIDASSHMVGKNKSIILLTTKCMLVDKEINV